jgi:hypothetical protein
MNFDAYLDQIPKLHTWDKGRTWCTGGFGREQLKCLHEFLCTHKVDSVIETGAGNSTITFLLSSATAVTSIAPDPDLFQRIEEYCREHAVPIEKLRKVVGLSQWELPKIAGQARGKVDFALLDGFHGWPIVFLDFYYLNHAVRRGGYLMLDDLQLYSVAELVRFLKEQPGYKEVLNLSNKAMVFRKDASAADIPDFGAQPYIKRQTRPWTESS